jgi:hypothetical protein
MIRVERKLDFLLKDRMEEFYEASNDVKRPRGWEQTTSTHPVTETEFEAAFRFAPSHHPPSLPRSLPPSPNSSSMDDTPPRPFTTLARMQMAATIGLTEELKSTRKRKATKAEFNSKGEQRKRKAGVALMKRPFSFENVTAAQYWQEWRYGLNGNVPLKEMEKQEKGKWRSDKLYPKEDGTTGGTLKAAWSTRKPIHEAIEKMIESGVNEAEAVATVQRLMNRHSKSGTKPRIQGQVRKRLVSLIQDLDGYVSSDGDESEEVEAQGEEKESEEEKESDNE